MRRVGGAVRAPRSVLTTPPHAEMSLVGEPRQAALCQCQRGEEQAQVLVHLILTHACSLPGLASWTPPTEACRGISLTEPQHQVATSMQRRHLGVMRDHPRPIAVCRAESVLKKSNFNCSCLAPAAGTYCHRLLCLGHQLITR